MSTPPRTTVAAVKGVLMDDYGTRADGTEPDLTPYIASASAVVDRVVVAAAAKPVPITLSLTEQELIERWLSAHYYTTADAPYSSKNTQGASGSFIRPQDEPYKDRAIGIDYSGCLNAILKRQFIQVAWLGKRPSEQIPVEDRD